MAPKRAARESTAPTSNPKISTKVGSGNVHRTPNQIILDIWHNYIDRTEQRTKLVDIFLTFLFLVGVLQFVYCLIAGNYPFNAFLSGFSATVGQFVLTVILRIQTNEKNALKLMQVSPERAFADYVFCSLILHFFCVNFIN